MQDTSEISPLSSNDPAIESELPKIEPIKIWIVSEELDMNCHFWISLAKLGNLSPNQLLNENSIEMLFEKAATDGITDHTPVMLTNTLGETPNFFYMIPFSKGSQGKESLLADRSHEIITSWNPENIGFYIPKELAGDEESHQMILNSIQTLVEESEIKDFYIYTGSRGVVQVLDSAHRIRLKFAAENLKFMVYH